MNQGEVQVTREGGAMDAKSGGVSGVGVGVLEWFRGTSFGRMCGKADPLLVGLTVLLIVGVLLPVVVWYREWYAFYGMIAGLFILLYASVAMLRCAVRTDRAHEDYLTALGWMAWILAILQAWWPYFSALAKSSVPAVRAAAMDELWAALPRESFVGIIVVFVVELAKFYESVTRRTEMLVAAQSSSLQTIKGATEASVDSAERAAKAAGAAVVQLELVGGRVEQIQRSVTGEVDVLHEWSTIASFRAVHESLRQSIPPLFLKEYLDSGDELVQEIKATRGRMASFLKTLKDPGQYIPGMALYRQYFYSDVMRDDGHGRLVVPTRFGHYASTVRSIVDSLEALSAANYHMEYKYFTTTSQSAWEWLCPGGLLVGAEPSWLNFLDWTHEKTQVRRSFLSINPGVGGRVLPAVFRGSRRPPKVEDVGGRGNVMAGRYVLCEVVNDPAAWARPVAIGPVDSDCQAFIPLDLNCYSELRQIVGVEGMPSTPSDFEAPTLIVSQFKVGTEPLAPKSRKYAWRKLSDVVGMMHSPQNKLNWLTIKYLENNAQADLSERLLFSGAIPSDVFAIATRDKLGGSWQWMCWMGARRGDLGGGEAVEVVFAPGVGSSWVEDASFLSGLFVHDDLNTNHEWKRLLEEGHATRADWEGRKRVSLELRDWLDGPRE